MSLSSTVSCSNGELLRGDRLFSTSAYIHCWSFSSRLSCVLQNTEYFIHPITGKSVSTHTSNAVTMTTNKRNKQPTKNKSPQCAQYAALVSLYEGCCNITVFRSMKEYLCNHLEGKIDCAEREMEQKKTNPECFCFPWVTKRASFCPRPAAVWVAGNISRLVARFREQAVRYQSFLERKTLLRCCASFTFFFFFFQKMYKLLCTFGVWKCTDTRVE